MTSKIAKFYAGRSVFITGGSGFVGKQIVEKLLRSCPEIDNIYLLMRAKKGENVQQRLKKTFESPVSSQFKFKFRHFELTLWKKHAANKRNLFIIMSVLLRQRR
jgi:thioester reductase-like protein